jgi:hypothetical protein
MSIKTIKIQLLAIPSEKLAGAYRTYATNPVSTYSKPQMAEWLATQIHNGTLTMVQVTQYAGSYIPPTWTPPPVVDHSASNATIAKAFPSTPIDVAVNAVVKAQADINALRSNLATLANQSNTLENRINSLNQTVIAHSSVASRTESTVLTQGQTLSKIEASLSDVTKAIDALKSATDIDAEPAVNAAVAAAFKRFKDGLTATEVIAIESKVDGLLVDRKTAQDVFGVDVRDMKGNHVMVDLYNHPNAPAIDPDFIWSEEVLKTLLMVQDADPSATPANMWCGGERGTGKSETARQFAAMTGRNYVRVNFQKHTTVDDIVGGLGLVNGSTEFVPAPLLQGFITPSTVVLLDEPTNADQAVLAILNGLLEVNSACSLGGVVRRRGAGVMVLGADNTMGAGDATGNYLGLKTMSAALMDRFPFKPEFDFLPMTVESLAIQKRTGCNQVLADHVVAAWHAMRGKVATGDIICAPSIRGAMAFIKACERVDPQTAWQLTVVNGSAEESVPALQAIFSACIDRLLIQDNI